MEVTPVTSRHPGARSFATCAVLPLMLPALFLAGVAGCAAQSGAVSPDERHAKCVVCECNADLACIDVTVDERTPRTELAGKTYFFCSEECRQDFGAQPRKFVRR